jgi:dipeptidase E
VPTRLLLMSNGFAPGFGYLEHAMPTLRALLAGAKTVAFVAYAQSDLNDHTARIAAALEPLDVAVVGVHSSRNPSEVVDSAGAVFVGGGNAFRLLRALQDFELIDVIAASAKAGKPYIGTSAGSNVACPTIRTTNDMPIIWPVTLDAIGLIPFQLNVHYPVADANGPHFGETRDQRIGEFLDENDVPVVALKEGSWLEVRDSTAVVGGMAGGRVFERGTLTRDVSTGAEVSYLLRARDGLNSPAT